MFDLVISEFENKINLLFKENSFHIFEKNVNFPEFCVNCSGQNSQINHLHFAIFGKGCPKCSFL